MSKYILIDTLKDKQTSYELQPQFSHAKSFYRKATVEVYSNGAVLYSYDTAVLALVNVDGKIRAFQLWSGYSQTTARHVDEFLRQNGQKPLSKKDWDNMPVYYKDYFYGDSGIKSINLFAKDMLSDNPENYNVLNKHGVYDRNLHWVAPVESVFNGQKSYELAQAVGDNWIRYNYKSYKRLSDMLKYLKKEVFILANA